VPKSLQVTKANVATASAELAVMRRSLAAWLRNRARNDQLGLRPANRPQVEAQLADRLHALLEQVMPNAALPHDAVSLAQIAITGQGAVSSGPEPMGGPLWLSWPVLIVGGLLIAVVTAIKSAADVAKDAEEKECIKAGACTDYGFWLKVGGIAMLAYAVMKGGVLNDLLKKVRS
jgi:hypothetical protein